MTDPPSLVRYILVTGSSSLGVKIGLFVLALLVPWLTYGLLTSEKLYHQQEHSWADKAGGVRGRVVTIA